jgi:hypothetical protein
MGHRTRPRTGLTTVVGPELAGAHSRYARNGGSYRKASSDAELGYLRVERCRGDLAPTAASALQPDRQRGRGVSRVVTAGGGGS